MPGKNELNQPRKDYFEPMHTAEHILNQTMVRMFGCPRSYNAHIEKKKSKCDYTLARAPEDEQVAELEAKVNEIIGLGLAVTEELMPRSEAAGIVDLGKLPSEAGDVLRIVRVGDYDVCACIGAHVGNTDEIPGRFRIISHDFQSEEPSGGSGRWRVRFKIEE